jgi:hypothetical protein
MTVLCELPTSSANNFENCKVYETVNEINIFIKKLNRQEEHYQYLSFDIISN